MGKSLPGETFAMHKVSSRRTLTREELTGGRVIIRPSLQTHPVITDSLPHDKVSPATCYYTIIVPVSPLRRGSSLVMVLTLATGVKLWIRCRL